MRDDARGRTCGHASGGDARLGLRLFELPPRELQSRRITPAATVAPNPAGIGPFALVRFTRALYMEALSAGIRPPQCGRERPHRPFPCLISTTTTTSIPCRPRAPRGRRPTRPCAVSFTAWPIRPGAATPRTPTCNGILQQIFGYNAFRGEQQDIIQTVTAGDDAMVLMPTGGGKSLCYQVPAIARQPRGAWA